MSKKPRHSGVIERVTYRSRGPSSLSGREWAAVRCSPEGPGLAGWPCSDWRDSPSDPECSRSSSGTGPGSTRPASPHPSPRSGASVASRLRRLAARAPSPLRASPEKGAGAARRLNEPPSHRASDSSGAAERGAPGQKSWEGRCDAAGTSTICIPIPGRCSVSSSRIRRLQPRLHS